MLRTVNVSLVPESGWQKTQFQNLKMKVLLNEKIKKKTIFFFYTFQNIAYHLRHYFLATFGEGWGLHVAL